MAISKVIYGEDTLMDLTADTVTAETLAAGTTAHNAAGEPVVGTVTMLTVDEITRQAALKVDKGMLGLNNVDNTSDLEKPLSTAQQAALAEKAPAGFVTDGHDTVTAQGWSGNWVYRKWASGIAECWTEIDIGDVYSPNTIISKVIALPFTLTGGKRVWCTPNNLMARYLTVPPHDDTGDLATLNITAQYSRPESGGCYIYVYVIGGWK